MSSFTDLEVFARVVAAGSLSGAGREIGMSPAVVSKRLRKLEDRLGTRLLQRTTRQVALTEAGQGFYERVIAILAGIEEAEAFVTRRSTLARGSLKVAAPASFGRMHLAPHIEPFLRDHPDLTLNLVLANDFIDIVGEGYDLAIRIAELADSSLVARRLAPVRRFLVAAPKYLERKGMPAGIEELADHACLGAPDEEPWRLQGPNGVTIFRPRGPLRSNSYEVFRQAALSGLGIALNATWEIGRHLADGTLVRVLPEYAAADGAAIHAVYASKRFLPAKVRLFIDYLSGLYGPTPYWEPANMQGDVDREMRAPLRSGGTAA